ncbi:MAG TPA: transporter substrate-binding domain-containing protein [Bacteroidia bacterium]|jgi:membrane-bound lytic murein transglycosylase F
MPSITNDLAEIQKRGKLVALTDNTSTSFYIYKGDPLGYEYEQLNSFAKAIGVELQIVIAHNMDTIFDQLNSGEVDIIAANLTVTQERSALVDFSDPLMVVPQVLIQRKPDGWENMSMNVLDTKLIRNTIDLSGKFVVVRKGSSFFSRLNSLSEEIGEKINIVEAPGELSTEQLISMVASGQINYTIADQNVALNNQTYYSNIDVETPISFPQKIAWAIRKDSPELLNALNSWMKERKNSEEDADLYAKYFKKKKSLGTGIGSYTSYSNGVSKYNELIKTYSKKIDWDWQLLASLIYQESHFSPTARSWAGANGFMQLVPATAKHYGLDTIDATAEQSLMAGTSYILDLDKYWKKYIPDKKERVKFVLASYNAGLGHVIDARNLAGKYGKKQNIWDDNVGNMILQKSNPTIYNDPIVKCGYCRGQETYLYVKDILIRYNHYKSIPESPPEALVKN